MRISRKLIAVTGAAALVGAAFVIPATAVDPTSDVHVVHGVPGATVDVCVDGAKALTDFQPNTRTDAVALTVGDHSVEIVAAGDDCGDGTVLPATTVTVPAAGLDLDLVAHLDDTGAVTLSPFVNDTSTTAAGSGRLVVRHTANFGAVDVLAGGAPIIEDLTNPNGTALEVPAGSYDVAVTAAGDPATVAAEVPGFALTAGVETIVYAVGTPGDDFALYPFTVAVGERATDRIGGADRFATAAMIAMQAYPDGADVVYLARGDAFPDALAAKSLTDGPILLVPACGDLPQATADAIADLDPDEIIALGGSAAVCPAIVEAAAAVTG